MTRFDISMQQTSSKADFEALPVALNRKSRPSVEFCRDCASVCGEKRLFSVKVRQRRTVDAKILQISSRKGASRFMSEYPRLHISSAVFIAERKRKDHRSTLFFDREQKICTKMWKSGSAQYDFTRICRSNIHNQACRENPERFQII